VISVKILGLKVWVYTLHLIEVRAEPGLILFSW